VPSQGPIIVLFQSALSRSRSVLEEFTEGFKGTVIVMVIQHTVIYLMLRSPIVGRMCDVIG